MQPYKSRILSRPIFRDNQIATFRSVATRYWEVAWGWFEGCLIHYSWRLRRCSCNCECRFRRSRRHYPLAEWRMRRWRGRSGGSQECRQAASENCQGYDQKDRAWVARINIFHTISLSHVGTRRWLSEIENSYTVGLDKHMSRLGEDGDGNVFSVEIVHRVYLPWSPGCKGIFCAAQIRCRVRAEGKELWVVEKGPVLP